jgi:hypothetical protein
MPQGCATWPAAWEVREDGWPNYGEVGYYFLFLGPMKCLLKRGKVDIIEGVNDVSPNAATLHTTTGCTMPAVNRPMTGCVPLLSSGHCSNFTCRLSELRPSWTATSTVVQFNRCHARTILTQPIHTVNYNAGCGVRMPTANSYGPAFNAAGVSKPALSLSQGRTYESGGGGYFAMERTSQFIKVWFWTRKSDVPLAVRTGAWIMDTNSFVRISSSPRKLLKLTPRVYDRASPQPTSRTHRVISTSILEHITLSLT